MTSAINMSVAIRGVVRDQVYFAIHNVVNSTLDSYVYVSVGNNVISVIDSPVHYAIAMERYL